MNKFKWLSVLFINLSIASSACIGDILKDNEFKIIGEKEIEIELSRDVNAPNTFNSPATPSTKKIKLLDIEIDDNLKSKLKTRFEKYLQKKQEFQATNGSGRSLDLDMNNVPVLDQGDYGTCATFAATAILDALFNVGDYISQQCLLEIGVYKYHFWQTYYPGWDGAYADMILKRVKYYGVVNKENCPHAYPDKKAWMMPFTYYSHSLKEPWTKKFNVKPLIPGSIHELKKALHQGNRVLISNLLYLNFAPAGIPVNGKNHGLWALPASKESVLLMLNDLLWNSMSNSFAGHAMIITGYDDTTQRFKLRNSWGSYAGDNGDFYMEYDYYFLLNLNALEVSAN